MRIMAVKASVRFMSRVVLKLGSMVCLEVEAHIVGLHISVHDPLRMAVIQSLQHQI